MTKTEKIFEMLRLIGEFPDLKAVDLAELIDSSERAVYRYLHSLRQAGFSIELRDDGYKLQGDYSDILGRPDIENLQALKLLVSEGMKVCEDEEVVERGRQLMKLIRKTLARRTEERKS